MGLPNSIAFVRNYTAVIDEVHQRAAVPGCLNSPRRMARAGRNAKEIMIPKIEVSRLGDYTRNVGCKTGSITYEFETKTFDYDRGIKLLADVMDVEEAGVLDCFVAAGSELQRTQVAPEADAFTFAEIAGHAGVTPDEEDFSDAEAGDVLASLRAATNAMDEAEVTAGSRILFITPALKGVLDDFSLANPARSNRVLERFSRVVEVPQTRFYTYIDLLNGNYGEFGYRSSQGGSAGSRLIVRSGTGSSPWTTAETIPPAAHRAVAETVEVLRRLRSASPLGGASHGRSDDHRDLRSALCSDRHREARRPPRVAGFKAVERNGGRVMRTAESGKLGPAMSLTARGADQKDDAARTGGASLKTDYSTVKVRSGE